LSPSLAPTEGYSRSRFDPGEADLVQSDPVVEESPALAGIGSASGEDVQQC